MSRPNVRVTWDDGTSQTHTLDAFLGSQRVTDEEERSLRAGDRVRLVDRNGTGFVVELAVALLALALLACGGRIEVPIDASVDRSESDASIVVDAPIEAPLDAGRDVDRCPTTCDDPTLALCAGPHIGVRCMCTAMGCPIVLVNCDDLAATWPCRDGGCDGVRCEP